VKLEIAAINFCSDVRKFLRLTDNIFDKIVFVLKC